MGGIRAVLSFVVSGSVSGLKKALDEGTARVRQFGRDAKDIFNKTEREARNMDSAFSSMSSLRGYQKPLRENATLVQRLGQRVRQFGITSVNAFKNTQIELANLRTAFAALGVGVLVRTLVRARLQLDSVESALRVATGSTTAAAREYGFIRQEADRLGLSLADTARDYAKLAAASRGTALEGQPTRDIFLGVSEAATALGLSAEQTGGALTAIEQIISKGKVSAEELRGQLGERLPGAFQIAARAMGKTTAELDAMLVSGELTAEELLPKLAAELRNTFGAEAAARAGGLQAELNRLKTVLFEIATENSLGGIVESVRSLRETLQDPSVQSSLQTFINSIIKLTEWSAKAVVFVADLGKAIGFNFTEAAKLTKEVTNLQRNIDQISQLNPNAPELKILKEDLAEAQAALDAIIDRDVKAGNVFGQPQIGVPKPAPVADLPTPTPTPAEVDPNDPDTKLIESLREQIRLAGLSRLEREKAIAVARLSADATEEERAEVELLAEQLYNLEEAQKNSTNQMEEFAKQAARNIQDSFSQFWFDPFEEGLGGLVRGFANAIRQMIAESLALQSIKFLQTVPGFGFLNVPTAHTGGLVNGGGRYISGVSPLAFAGAQRYHTGGLLGLGPDEVPIIGKRTEEMITRDDPRHRFNGGLGGGDGGLRIINLLDSQSIADAMNSPAGEKVILNTIRKNPEATRRG